MAATCSKRPAAGSSTYDVPVPLLVTVVGGNAVTAAAVLACLDTVDANALRRLHPAVAAHVAAMPWADTATGVFDTARWRAALPAAVGYKLGTTAPGTLISGTTWRTKGRPKVLEEGAPAALRGVTVLDLESSKISDAVIVALPPTLRRLDLTSCWGMTEAVSYTHLPALESLSITGTSMPTGLPPSLRELAISPPKVADFGHLHSLRVLRCHGLRDANIIASLPPSLEELDVSHGLSHIEWPHDWSAAHLTRLRVLRATHCGIHGRALAALPPSLHILDLECSSKSMGGGASLAHLTSLHTLNLNSVGVCDRMLASLPPSLVSLNLEGKHQFLSSEAEFPRLPALRVLNVSNTYIGDAAVASLPRGLEELRMVDCGCVTQRASLDHLTALRVLQSSGTDLPRATIEACRARGCFAPADGYLCTNPSNRYDTMVSVALLASGRLVSCTYNGCLSVWEAARGDAAATLNVTGSRRCSALVVLADGHRVAIGMPSLRTGGVVVCDTRSAPHDGTHVPTCIPFDACVGVCKLAVLHNGHLLTGCTGGKLRIVDADAGAVVATLEGHATAGTASSDCNNEVQALAVLLDGRVASTTHDDCMVWIWELGRRVCVDKLEGHTNTVNSLAVLVDGRLASGSHDKTVRLWDMRSRSSVCLVKLPTGYHFVRALALLPGGRLASTAWDGTLMVWDTHNATRAPPPPVTVMLESQCSSAMVSLPDGRLVTCARGLRLWLLPPEAQAPL